ncbi:unnamed protein product [Owenia fusiformis]|uniref:Uncharacterized protein n=1 Tax=Owenia fusiformis TaxID=6347 RepID=A0A8J1UR04_OWEFU|nr:unnamed protein product [Owenia fusiformis]
MAGRGRGTHIRVKKLEKPRPLRSVSEDLTAVNQAFEPDNQKEDIDDVFLGEEEYDRRTPESYADSRVPPLPDGSMLNWVRAIEYELEKGNYIDADIQAICESIQMKGPLMDRINSVCLDPVFEAVRRVIRQPDLTGLDRLSLLEVIEMRANDWEPNGPRHEFYTKAYPQMEARFAAENRDAGTYASKRMIHNTLNIKLAPELQREPPHIQADGDTYEPNNNPPNIDKLNFVKQVEELCLQNGNNKDKESEIDSPDIPVYDSPCHIPVRSDNINPILATLEKVINERKLNIPQKKLTASRSVKKFMKSVSEDNEIQIIKELYGKKSDCEFINDVVDHDTDKFTPKEAHDITRLVTKEDNQKTLQFPVQNTPAVDLTKMKYELKNLQLTTNIHENKPSKSARPHSLEDNIAFRRSNSENDVGHNYYEKESIGKLSLVNDKYKGPSKKKWRDEWLMRNFDEEGSGSSYESSRASTVSPPIERMSSLRMDAEDIFKPQDNKKKKSDTTIFSISIRDSKVFTHKVSGFIAMATDTSIQRIEGLGDSEVAIFEISGPIKGRNLAVARIAEYCQSIVKNPREWVQQHDLLKQQQQQKVKNEPPPKKEDPVINHISDKAQWEDNCGQYVYHLTIKSIIMGRLLGVQGQRIKVIEEESETNISVYKNDKDLMYRPVVVYGPSIEAVGIAVDMIEECIALNAEPSRIPRSRVVSTSSHLSTASSYTLSESDSPHTDRDHGHASRNYESQGGIQMQHPNAVIKYTQATSQSKSDVPMTPRGRGRGRGMMSLKKEAPPPGISRQVSCPAICSQSESSKVPLVVSPSTNLKRSEDDLDWEDVDSGEIFKFGQKHYGVTSFAINQAAPYNGLGTKGDDKATKPINKSSGIINTSPTTLSQDMPSSDARDMFPEEKPIRGLKSRQARKLNIESENTRQNAQETILSDKMRESNNSMTSPSSPARPLADTPPKEAPLRIIHRSPKRPESSVKAPNEQLAEDEQVKGQSKETIAAEMQKLETTIRQLSLDDDTLIEAFENVRRKLNQGQDDNETLETNPFAEKTSPVQVSMSRKLEFDNERSKLEKGNILNWRKGAVKTPPVDQYASGDPPRLFHERDSSRLFHERDPPRLFKRSLSHQETSSSSWRRNETMDQGMFSSSTSEDGSFGEAASASKGPVWRPPNREFRAGSGSHPGRGNAVAFLRQPLGALQTDDLFDSVEETMPVGPNTATHRRHLFRETSSRFHAKQLLKQTPTHPKYRYNRTELFRGMTSLVGLSMPHEWMYLVRTLPEICLKEPHHPNLRKLSTELQESAKKTQTISLKIYP